MSRAQTGSVVHGIFDVLSRALGRSGRVGGGKLVEINGVSRDDYSNLQKELDNVNHRIHFGSSSRGEKVVKRALWLHILILLICLLIWLPSWYIRKTKLNTTKR